MTSVSPMIDVPQLRPTVLCQNLRIASLMSIRGWRMLARTNTGLVGGSVAEQSLALDRVDAAVAERVAAQHPPGRQQRSTQDAEGANGLDGILRARRMVLAPRR